MTTTRPPKPAAPKRQSGGIRCLTPEEGHQFFDEQARRRLGISGEEFLRRLDADHRVIDATRLCALEHLHRLWRPWPSHCVWQYPA
jgi:hypothetical protein